MTLDWDKLEKGLSGTAQIEPRKIFSTLAREPRFKRPTDEQGEVLDAWFGARTQQDLTVKMNTGSGKTLVGLLLLQSCLNEGVSPAVYIAPDNYLVEQVVNEAKSLGIAVTSNERDLEFLSGEAILVINVHKLFNGRSVFGVGGGGAKIPIGSLVIDDAHACLTSVADQFALRIPRDDELYDDLLELFHEDLAKYSPTGILDIDAGDPHAILAVPYWSWKDRSKEVLELIHSYRKEENVEWKWPLMSGVLKYCQCVFGSSSVEIAPRCLPIDMIPAFMRAKRRVYMTATLADDGVLVTHFNADPKSVAKPIKPRGAGDIGDRMILAPQEINPATTEDEVKALVAKIAKERNAVAIVPSFKRAEFWKDIAAQILDKDSIADGVKKMRKAHVGLTVLVNKYDGIDLPYQACELLVIDGLPEAYGLIERIELAKLEGTEIQSLRQVQKLEQGMGRGVRSSDDHCVVLLLGSRLTQRVHLPATRAKFTAATQAQLKLGREVSTQVAGKPLSELIPILSLCLNRDPKWVAAARRAVAEAPDQAASFLDSAVPHVRHAFDLARDNKVEMAFDEMQQVANSTAEPSAKGYYLEQAAEYMQQLNPSRSQEVLSSAITYNRQVTKPIEGIRYSKLDAFHAGQAKAATEFLKQFSQGNDLIIWSNALVADLSWDPDETKAFESAIENLGSMIGFNSQRPERDLNKGPDNLWALGDLKYLVIECKSGAISETISKKDSDQLTGSMNWFEAKYDSSCSGTPVMIHPSNIFDKQAAPHAKAKVIDDACMKRLRSTIIDYAVALGAKSAFTDVDAVSDLLKHFKLTGGAFLDAFSVKYRIAR